LPVGASEQVHAGIGIPLHTAKMAMIAGPVVAAVETTSAVVTETVSTIQVRPSPAQLPLCVV
jgi:hypothetical protein